MKKYNHYLFIAAAMFAVSCGPSDAKKEEAQKNALADTTKTTDILQVDTKDAAFVNNATLGGMLEVQMGTLAQRNALNQQVKEFGEMMVKDHQKADGELKSIANGKKLGVPQSLGKEFQDRVDSMALKTSVAFDLKYMDIMVAAHKKDVADFEKATTELKDPDLKAFAVKTLPTLKMHLSAAEKLDNEINKKNAANNSKM
ncbi:DUF4142 domain-containing protein [Mucilaginibacter sp.]|uniref:DUF4142 domain-containing protein n=1 Tax=Mucilaginibacter sp. TaxID=1882438 RepID=UPI003AFF7D78